MYNILIKFIKKNYFKLFPIFEEQGLHITYNHFYSPIPDTRVIEPYTFNMQFLNIDIKTQFNYLKDLIKKYKNELSYITDKFIGNCRFDGLDALIAYMLIREFSPENIIEIGSGYSTIIQAEALNKNNKGKITSIEPFPDMDLRSIKYVENLIKDKIENVDIEIFTKLKENDILFIDSSHIVKANSDVLKIFTEILPILNNGVIIHFHDIFLPLDYPLSWIKKEYRFWNEQYFLYNFLLFNNSFKTIFSNSYLGMQYPEEIKKFFPEKFVKNMTEIFKEFFPDINWFGGGSYWIKKGSF